MNINRNSSTVEVTEWIAKCNFPCTAERVGAWVWLYFKSKPSVEIRSALKEAGFIWNKRRECWQHACGIRSKKTSKDPRFYYDTETITTQPG